MKAWELIKALEEGFKIRKKDYDYKYTFDEYKKFENLDLLKTPDLFEIVKSKKKIKLYRYTHKVSDEIHQSLWVSVLWENWSHHNNYKLLKTEEKEIEVDE